MTKFEWLLILSHRTLSILRVSTTIMSAEVGRRSAILMIVSAQVQEMASIRAHLYEIEKMHQRIKAE